MKLPFNIGNIFNPQNQSSPPRTSAPAIENRSPQIAADGNVAAAAISKSVQPENISEAPPQAAMPAGSKSIMNNFRRANSEKRLADVQAQLEADSIRRERRAENARLHEANRADAEAARKAQEAAARERERFQLTEKARPRTWEEKFATYWRGELAFTASEKLLLAIIHRAKLDGFMREMAAKIQPFSERFDLADAERHKIGPLAANALFKETMLKNYEAINAGHDEKILELPDRERLEKSYENRRLVFRAKMKSASADALPVVLEAATRLQAAARDLAVEIAEQERQMAAEFGCGAEPSLVLRHIIQVGFMLVDEIKRTWVPGPMCDPHHALFGLIDPSRK